MAEVKTDTRELLFKERREVVNNGAWRSWLKDLMDAPKDVRLRVIQASAGYVDEKRVGEVEEVQEIVNFSGASHEERAEFYEKSMCTPQAFVSSARANK